LQQPFGQLDGSHVDGATQPMQLLQPGCVQFAQVLLTALSVQTPFRSGPQAPFTQLMTQEFSVGQ
jgi:hypothetical protein